VKLYIIKNPSDHFSYLEKYEADHLDIFGIFAMVPHVIDRARQRHAGDYISLPSLGTYFISFNVLKSPFNDILVRQAFVLATDREMLTNVILRYVSPATGGLVPLGMPGHSAGIALPYDPEGARKLLAEAGYPDGRDFPRIRCLAPTAVDSIKDYLLAQWRDNLGVEIEWESTVWTEYLERIRSEEIPEICWHGWIADYPDPDSVLRVGLQPYPEKWRLENFIKLLEKARRITDQKKRVNLYTQADKILVQEAVVMPLNYGRTVDFMKPWVSKCPSTGPYIYQWKDVILEPH
jgi:oligopeptide transport system substrate-binding protein